MRARINKLDCIKLKSFFTQKGTIFRMKRKFTEWDKTFIESSCDRGLISRIYKKLKKLNTEEQ
jgi:hypothetical protein